MNKNIPTCDQKTSATPMAQNLFVETINVKIWDRSYHVPAFHLLESPHIRDGLQMGRGDSGERTIDLSNHASKEEFEALIGVLHPSTSAFDQSPRGRMWLRVLDIATRLVLKPARAAAIHAILSGAAGNLTPVEKLLLGHQHAIPTLFFQGCAETIFRTDIPTPLELQQLYVDGIGARIMVFREKRVRVAMVDAKSKTPVTVWSLYYSIESVKEAFADILKKLEDRARQFGDIGQGIHGTKSSAE
ncbi:hypothetical protein NLJ89_g4606 [Agrocybe chaxingu]|uniref:Uncharacterized protein n=1 Tax=Agrocybe chaxingu TaxID=84603 RepID=A0A9W8MWD3_9AGAR|nr:hypothetical protein NLJ89_g4606 [Agrocybe chaxingu]